MGQFRCCSVGDWAEGGCLGLREFRVSGIQGFGGLGLRGV